MKLRVPDLLQPRFILALAALSSFAVACSPGQPVQPPTAVADVVNIPTAEVVETVTVEAATETPVPTEVPATVTPAPTPTPVPKPLTLCVQNEPESLYIYSQAAQGWGHIQELLRDGPYETKAFGLQPVILTALPSLEDGSARFETVRVVPGQPIVTTEDELVFLEAGVTYWTPDLEIAEAIDGETVETIQMVVDYQLLPDVTWSDGTPLTAADSVLGYEILAEETAPYLNRFVINRTVDYRAVDAQTTQWRGAAGFFNTDYQRGFHEPLPVHVYGELSAEELQEDSAVNLAPLGWGAFQIAEWQPGRYIKFTPNPHYYRAAEGLPHLTEVKVEFVEDAQQAAQRVISGTCDVSVRDAWNAWETEMDTIVAAADAGAMQLQYVTGPLYEAIDFGALPGLYYRSAAGRDVFTEPELRQALAHCIDRESLIDAVQWGQGEVANIFMPSTHPEYAETAITTYDYDPAKGNRLLDEIGWDGINNNGVRFRNGNLLSLRYNINLPESYTGQLRETVANLVVEDLAECGVFTEISTHTAIGMYSDWPDSILFGRQFDLGHYGWLLPGEPRCSLYTTSEIATTDYLAGSNASGYSNEAFDAACAAMDSATTADERERQAKIVQRQFSQDLPSLPLFFRQRIAISNPKLLNYDLDATHPSPLWNIENWDIAE